MVFWFLGIPRLVVIAVQRNSNSATLLRLELLLEESDCPGMRHDERLADSPLLSCRIAYSALLVRAASPGSIDSLGISLTVR